MSVAVDQWSAVMEIEQYNAGGEVAAGSNAQELLRLIRERAAIVGVIGLGYVGLPLAVAVAQAGFQTIGFDTDTAKPFSLHSGRSYIDAVSDAELAKIVNEERFSATSEMGKLADCDLIVICVPTPLTRYREPDLSYVTQTCETIARHLRPRQAVVLESTTYPGTTEEVMRPILERAGLKSGVDFFLGFSPEREDPGNEHFRTRTIPKVVSGDGADALGVIEYFFRAVIDTVVPVSSPRTAEAVKITENIFRSANIALVNELKVIYDRMDIDIWEVIEAAKTKPFGFMPFYPGPGLGGHCIPIDPFYLTWKAREYGLATRFIELAGEINSSMPLYVVSRLEEALDRRFGVSLSRARIMVIGLAYKKNVADLRESPTLKIIEILEARGASCDFHDPLFPKVPMTREHPEMAGRLSMDITPDGLAAYDAVVISTDHDAVDYAMIGGAARLVIDTRNVLARFCAGALNVVKA